MTAQPATAILTPAADALARAKDDLAATVERIRDDFTRELSALKREALVEQADGWMSHAKRETKGTLVAALASRYAEESGAGQSLAALRAAARDERLIIEAIEEAAATEAKAKANIAVQMEKWNSPESVADAAVAWQKARATAGQWKAVEGRAAEVGPIQALVDVARYAAADLISTAGSGMGRSTDAVRNVMAQADVAGTYAFLRAASYRSKEVSTLIRY